MIDNGPTLYNYVQVVKLLIIQVGMKEEGNNFLIP